MALRLLLNVLTLLVVAVASPTLSSSAEQTRPGYVVTGGTVTQQAEIRRALEASSFDWSLIPEVVTVRIAKGPENWAKRGRIRLSADLLDRGRESWGVVQHEFAHQVDLLLLGHADRVRLARKLGARVWFDAGRELPHGERGAERFASTLAWAYWQSPSNSMRPRSPSDESAAMRPAEFRAFLARVIREQPPVS